MWLVAAGLAVSSCVGSHFGLADAQRMVLAGVSLTPSAARAGAVAKVELIQTLPGGWQLRAYAVPACASGVEVCSNLLGHYFVGRTRLDLIDEDAGLDGVTVETPDTRWAREEIIRARCRETRP